MQISQEDYKTYKPLLFSLGYRMLGSVQETEDLVQETFLRVFRSPRFNIDNKKAFLCRTMTNLCLDVLKSARVKREQYIGPWHPEPLLLEEPLLSDPSYATLAKENISIAYLRMMETLSPNERAVLLLKEVFEFAYSDIATMINKSESTCRKLNSRAKQKLSTFTNESLDYTKNKTIITQFIDAFQREDVGTLLTLVSDRITLYSDGGGKVKAAVRPIHSYQNVLAFLSGIAKKATGTFDLRIKNINNQPGIVIHLDGYLYSVISFFITEEQIHEIYMILNPDKLSVYKNDKG